MPKRRKETAMSDRPQAIDIMYYVATPEFIAKWTDAKKGELASEERQKEVFGTADPLAVAKEILARGEVQLSSEFREKLRAD